MKRQIVISFILTLAVNTVSAQDIFVDLRQTKQGQGTVVINQSQEVETLVRQNPVEHTATPSQAETSPSQHPTHNSAAETAQRHETETIVGSAEDVNTSRKIMRHSYKATGYRIQVYTGTGSNKRDDKARCDQIAAQLKSRFPNLPIYVHFYSPNWKCRAGNFTSIEEARKMLAQIKAMGYSQACLVKGTINVQY